MQLVYFGRRDKKAIDVVGLCPSDVHKSIPYQLDNLLLHRENIPVEHFQKLQIWQQKMVMDWQLYVENFKDYDDFVNRMTQRGYKGLPNTISPILFRSDKEIVKPNMPTSKKMLQRKIS
jgi:hypothetical protein